MSKITAIMGGGDWADASVEFVILPDGVTIYDAKNRYDEWYHGEYIPAYRKFNSGPRSIMGVSPKFYTFPEWCFEKEDAIAPAEDRPEEYWEY